MMIVREDQHREHRARRSGRPANSTAGIGAPPADGPPAARDVERRRDEARAAAVLRPSSRAPRCRTSRPGAGSPDPWTAPRRTPAGTRSRRSADARRRRRASSSPVRRRRAAPRPRRRRPRPGTARSTAAREPAVEDAVDDLRPTSARSSSSLAATATRVTEPRSAIRIASGSMRDDDREQHEEAGREHEQPASGRAPCTRAARRSPAFGNSGSCLMPPGSASCRRSGRGRAPAMRAAADARSGGDRAPGAAPRRRAGRRGR